MNKLTEKALKSIIIEAIRSARHGSETKPAGLITTPVPGGNKVLSRDLETFIQHVYGTPYDIAYGEEQGDEHSLNFEVAQGKNTEYEEGRIARWKSGQDLPHMCGYILNDLCDKGLIPAGTYTVVFN